MYKYLYLGIKKLYPNIKNGHFELRDNKDGKGPYLHRWSSEIEKPSLNILNQAGEEYFNELEAIKKQDKIIKDNLKKSVLNKLIILGLSKEEIDMLLNEPDENI